MSGILYPPDLVDELLTRLREIHVPFSLSPEQMREVLDVAYAATMLEEEGRRTVFTLAFADPAAAANRFATSRAFNPGEVAKLAPATHPQQTYVGIYPDAGKLSIWGLLHVGERQFGIDLELQPDLLRVTGWRPGVLTVDFGNDRLLHFANGNAHWYGKETQFSDVLHAAASAAAVRINVETGKLLREYERLAERIVLAGHGGALLFYQVGESTLPPPGVAVPTETTFPHGDTTLAKAFQNDEALAADLAAARKRNEEPSQVLLAATRLAEQKHRSALDYVARLANVDGAVVLRPDLTVIGFGATITTKALPSRLLLEDPGVSGRVREEIAIGRFKGHRHKSAVNYCAEQTPTANHNANRDLRGFIWAFAIVGSQDGTLSVFGVAGDDVVAVRPLLLRRAVR